MKEKSCFIPNVQVQVRPSDISLCQKRRLLDDPVTLGIKRALSFPAFLYVGTAGVMSQAKGESIKFYRLPPVAETWRRKHNLGEDLKPLIFYLILRAEGSPPRLVQ